MFLRTPYNFDRDAASVESGLLCEDVSLAKQSFKDECDINVILKRFSVTGQLPDNVRTPTYGDFTGVGDYQGAMNAVRAADEAFMALPADVRYRFANDPQRLLEFCADPANLDEARKLGLAVPAVEPGVEPVAPASSKEA